MTVSVRTTGPVQPVDMRTLLHGFDEATAKRLIAAGLVEIHPSMVTAPALPAVKGSRKGK